MIQISNTPMDRAGVREIVVEGQKLFQAYITLGGEDGQTAYLGSYGATEEDSVHNLLQKVTHFSQSIQFAIADDLGPIRVRHRHEQLEKFKSTNASALMPNIPEPSSDN